MRRFSLIFTLTILFSNLFSQVFTPVKWKFDIVAVKGDEYVLRYTATVDKGWTIYSQYTSEDGPVPTSVNYEEMAGIQLLGKAKESGARKEGMDALFGVNVIKFTSDKAFIIEEVKSEKAESQSDEPESIPQNIVKDSTPFEETTFVGAKITGDKIDQKISALASTYEHPISNCGGEEQKKEG